MSERPRISFEPEPHAPRLGVALSIALHALVSLVLLFSAHRFFTTEIIAAGPGEGGEGGGGSITVGLADPSSILGFAKPKPVAYIGDKDDAINNAKVETVRKAEEHTEDVLPKTEREVPDPKSLKTDRPVAEKQERVFTGKEERGRSTNPTAQVGSSYGSPTPGKMGSLEIGSGGGTGGGTGVPGGSEYGRRIQMIFSRNYNPSAGDNPAVQTVIITLRISREGRIVSLVNGRVDPSAIRQRAALQLINNAAERAIIASDPLPPFPPGFLPGVQEVSVNLIFRYPK